MTDTSQDIPQPIASEIHWWQSAIIWKQIVVGVCTIMGAFGYMIDQQQQTGIVSAVMSVAALVAVGSTIVDRVRRPCPTISNKIIPTKGN